MIPTTPRFLINNFLAKELYWLGAITITVVGVFFWSVNRGLIFSDESFYLLHLRDQRAINVSSWYYYAKAFFPTNLPIIRLLTVMGLIVSALVFVAGFSKFFNVAFWKPMCLAIIGLFIFGAPIQLVPNYITFNIQILYASFGLILLGSAITRQTGRVVSFVAAGGLAGCLIFIMITNSPYIGVSLILIYFISSKDDRIANSFYLVGGILLSIALYFIAFQSPSDYLQSIAEARDYLAYDKTHSLKSIFVWVLKTIQFSLFQLVVPSLAAAFLFMPAVKHRSVLIRLAGLAVLFYFLFYTEWRSSEKNVTSVMPFFVLTLSSLMILINKLRTEQLAVCLFALILPFMGSLGTRVDFAIRAAAYLVPCMVMLGYLISRLRSSSLSIALNILLMICLINFITFIRTPGWAGYSIVDQNTPFTNITVGTVLLDKKTTIDLHAVSTIIPNNAQVIINTPKLYGYVYLLNWQVPFLYYYFNEDMVAAYFTKSGIDKKQFYLIEEATKPYSTEFKKFHTEAIDTISLHGKLYSIYQSKKE